MDQSPRELSVMMRKESIFTVKAGSDKCQQTREQTEQSHIQPQENRPSCMHHTLAGTGQTLYKSIEQTVNSLCVLRGEGW
ncbi:hypothetical protein NQZ68_029476 [Dissostichus eleginoides]|nr:hypothetical protein NQZ68_029476 [Dissostichus eleginoides]